jgi:hypothetical protein
VELRGRYAAAAATWLAAGAGERSGAPKVVPLITKRQEGDFGSAGARVFDERIIDFKQDHAEDESM